MQQLQSQQNIFARSPTLHTILMVEHFIEEYSGEYNKTELWKELPKKVMWQTYLLILEYLVSINKIGWDENDVLVYIWNPEGIKRFASRKRY